MQGIEDITHFRHNTSDDDEAALLSDITEKFERCSDHRQSYESKWKLADEAFRRQFHNNSNPSKVWYYWPIVWQVVMANRNRMMLRRPDLRLSARTMDGVDFAHAVQTLLEYFLDSEHSRSHITLMRKSHDMILYGTGFSRVGFDERKRSVERPVFLGVDPDTGGPFFERTNIPILDYAGPTLEYADLFDVWVPGFIAKEMRDMPYLFHGQIRTLDDIKDDDIYSEEAIAKLETQAGAESRGTTSRKELLQNAGVNMSDLKENEFYVLTYYTRDRFVVTANLEHILVDRDNPFDDGRIPFVDAHNYRMNGEYYSEGEYLPLADVQDMYNVTMGMAIEGIHYGIAPVYAVRKNSVPDEAMKKRRPGHVIPVSGVQDIRQAIQTMGHPGIGNDTFWLLGQLDQTAQQTAGVSNQMKGVPGNQKVATSILKAQENADVMLTAKQEQFQRETLSTILDMFLERTAQYSDKVIPIHVPGIQGMEEVLLDSEILGLGYNYSFEASATSPSAAEMKRRKLLEMLPVLGNEGFAQYIRRGDLLEEFMRAWEIPQAQKFIKSEQEVADERHAMMMEQAQMQAQFAPQTQAVATTQDLRNMG